MGSLAALDYALIAMLLLSGLIGLMRGIFREAMSLAVWIAALWVASRYAWWLSPYLAQFVPNSHLRLWAARLVLFMGGLILGGLVTWLVAMALRSTRLDGTDRAAGMVFGLARGVLLVAITIVLLRLAGVTDEPWWRQSKLVPYATPVADALRDAAEQGLGWSWSLRGSP